MNKKQPIIKGFFTDLLNDIKRACRIIPLFFFIWAAPKFEDLPGKYEQSWSKRFDYRIPWDNLIIHKAKEQLKSNGWKLVNVSEDLNSWKSTRWHYFSKNVLGKKLEFCLIADTRIEGATCEIKQIGEKEEIKKTPVYEVICPEGAKENTFDS